MSFTYPVTVRLYDTDRAGIVFFAKFYEFCEATLEEFLTQTLGSFDMLWQAGNFILPLVHSEADYCLPTRLGERLQIILRVKDIGKTSITFAYTIVGPDQKTRALVHLVHVCVDAQTFAPIAVPDNLRQALQSLVAAPQ